LNALEAIGGQRPLRTEEFANRAHAYALNPQRNSVKEALDRCTSVEATPPMLGIFNDIPWNLLREDEVHAWAKAGFSWICNDAEHCQREGWYGKQQNAMEGRVGLLQLQRLHREAFSAHGDVFQLGARATMKPYGTTYEQAERFFRAVNFPTPGEATPDDRGGYPVRLGDRDFTFTPDSLLGAETQTQGWIQFETGEYIINTKIRDQVLDLMAEQGANKACGFVGPFDAILREGVIPEMEDATNDLFRRAAERGVHTGRVVGSGSMEDPKDIEDAMVVAIENGSRLICAHPFTSDLAFRGAMNVTEPFFRAAERCGF
jgi:2-keto-3-deoxy-L-rhamnonate aldolase RhmA